MLVFINSAALSGSAKVSAGISVELSPDPVPDKYQPVGSKNFTELSLEKEP